jgi:hypothetical protein
VSIERFEWLCFAKILGAGTAQKPFSRKHLRNNYPLSPATVGKRKWLSKFPLEISFAVLEAAVRHPQHELGALP